MLAVCFTVLVAKGCEQTHEAEMKCLAKGNFSYVNSRCLPEASK